MYVVVATRRLGCRLGRPLLSPALRIFGTAGFNGIESFTVSLDPAYRQRIHFQNLRVRDKLVHKLLTIHFFNDVLYIVVSQGSAELVVIHIRLVLANAPETRHLLGLQKLELAIVRRPADHVLILRLLKELKKELPQSDGTVHSKGRAVRGNPSRP